ncbi:MAG: HAD family phosphatase [Planctomycetaceae bacterium]|nr:HAD family phosphatase [Planctomycetaceae bacterium]
MAIRTCFFDMGNVLVYFSHERMCRNIADLSGMTIEKTREFLFADGRQWKLERGEISEELFCDQLQETSGRLIRLSDLQHAAANIFWLNDSIVPVLQKLKAAGMRLVLLSNTSITHLRFIEERFDILKYMDTKITSFEVGALKPDRPIFEAALKVAQCAPEECFYTDDIAAYITAASEFGINARVYHKTHDLITELQSLGIGFV